MVSDGDVICRLIIHSFPSTRQLLGGTALALRKPATIKESVILFATARFIHRGCERSNLN